MREKKKKEVEKGGEKDERERRRLKEGKRREIEKGNGWKKMSSLRDDYK